MKRVGVGCIHICTNSRWVSVRKNVTRIAAADVVPGNWWTSFTYRPVRLWPSDKPYAVLIGFSPGMRFLLFRAKRFISYSIDVWAAQFLGGLWSSNFKMVSPLLLWNVFLRRLLAIKMCTYHTCSSSSKWVTVSCWICTAHTYTFIRCKRTRSPRGCIIS